MPNCKDFERGLCKRMNCKFTHAVGVRNHLPARASRPVLLENVKYQNTCTLVQLSYAISELPVKLSITAPGYKECVDFCVLHGIKTLDSGFQNVSESYHPIDGKVLRDVATRRGLAAAIKLVSNDAVKSHVSIIDLWGNNRTLSHLKAACSSLGNYELASKLYTYKCVAGQYDAKDLLRSNGRSNFIEMDVTKISECDIILIQDVQQVSTAKFKIMEYMLKTQVLVVIGHIETGPMGFNGYHGFYLRDGSEVLNWASCEDAPYVDHDDLVWVLNDNTCDMGSYQVNWCVQKVYGNTVFVVFTKNYIQLAASNVQWTSDFLEVELEVTNPGAERNYVDWFRWLPTELLGDVEKWLGARTISGISYEPIARKGADFLKGNTFGMGTDKRLDSFIGAEFKKEKRFDCLRNNRYTIYRDLEIITTAQARRYEVHRLHRVAELGVSQAGAIRRATDWRNLTDSSSSFDRWSGCLWLAVPVTCMSGIVLVSSAAFGDCLKRVSKPRIQLHTLPSSDLPQAFKDAVSLKADLSVLEISPGVYKFGTHKFPKRVHTQTPVPAEVRLGPDGKVTLRRQSATLEYPFNINDTEDRTAKEFTYMYGPNYVCWHSNEESVGGAIGMINALLTGVVLNDGQVLTALESARRGQKMVNGVWMDTGSYDTIYVEQLEQLDWARRHDKHHLYLPALEKVISEGRKPYNRVLKLKAKTNELLLKDKERIIIASDPEFTAFYGAEASLMNKRIKEHFSLPNLHKTVYRYGKAGGHFTWGSGTTPSERGAWFDDAMLMPTNHFAVTACGDDVAIILNHGGLVIGVESDASNWDHSQILLNDGGDYIGSLNVERYYYWKFGASKDFIESLIESEEVRWSINQRKKGDNFVIDMGYKRRCSGLPDTTDGNTLVMGHLMMNVMSQCVDEYEEGDIVSYYEQNVARIGAEYGVRLKVKIHTDPYRMTFLKGFYVNARIDNIPHTVWYPSPEILVKIGYSPENPANNVEYSKLQKMHRDIVDLPYWLRAYDIVNSWKSFTGMPVLTAFQLLVTSPVKTTYEESRLRASNMDKWDKPELDALVTHQDWGPMLDVLGITKDSVDEFTALCANVDWRPGMFVIHPVVAALASRYA